MELKYPTTEDRQSFWLHVFKSEFERQQKLDWNGDKRIELSAKLADDALAAFVKRFEQ